MLAFSVRSIILGIALGVFLLLFVIFPLAIFFVALFERRKIKPLVPIESSRKPTPIREEQDFIAASQADGFALLGNFSDGDPGKREGIYTLLLSPDGETLLLLRHRRAARIMLISQFEGSRWLITCNVSGARDIVGLEDEQMYPKATFQVLRSFHAERLAQRGEVPIRFAPDSAVADIASHWREQAMQAVNLGFARTIASGVSERWVFTAAGAARISWLSITSIWSIARQAEVTKNRSQELDSMLRTGSDFRS
jgi:hypothetical protein